MLEAHEIIITHLIPLQSSENNKKKSKPWAHLEAVAIFPGAPLAVLIVITRHIFGRNRHFLGALRGAGKSPPRSRKSWDENRPRWRRLKRKNAPVRGFEAVK